MSACSEVIAAITPSSTDKERSPAGRREGGGRTLGA